MVGIVGFIPALKGGAFSSVLRKWTAEPVGYELVDSLTKTANDVRWGPPDRTECFALFSRSGFVDGLTEDVDDNWSLFGPAELSDLL